MSSDHEYLINQLQFQQPSVPRIKLNFDHPLGEIIWIAQQELVEKKFKREYLNFKLIELLERNGSNKTLNHVKKSPGIPLYYFYKKFNLN